LASLFGADCDFSAQRGKPQLLQLCALFQKPQSFPQNFTLGLLVPGLEKVGNELVAYGTEIHVHIRTVPLLPIIVNY
jgi:hypothetical protein